MRKHRNWSTHLLQLALSLLVLQTPLSLAAETLEPVKPYAFAIKLRLPLVNFDDPANQDFWRENYGLNDGKLPKVDLFDCYAITEQEFKEIESSESDVYSTQPIYGRLKKYPESLKSELVYLLPDQSFRQCMKASVEIKRQIVVRLRNTAAQLFNAGAFLDSINFLESLKEILPEAANEDVHRKLQQEAIEALKQRKENVAQIKAYIAQFRRSYDKIKASGQSDRARDFAIRVRNQLIQLKSQAGSDLHFQKLISDYLEIWNQHANSLALNSAN